MIGEILVVSLCLVGSVIVFFVIKSIVAEGLKDDLLYPLGSCDTSMFEELMSDEKTISKKHGVV